MLRSISRSAASARLVVDRRAGVPGDRHGELADVGVERGVEDALLGHLSAEHEALDAVLAQQVVERRLPKDRVAALEDERDVIARSQRLDQSTVRPFPDTLEQRAAVQRPVLLTGHALWRTRPVGRSVTPPELLASRRPDLR